MLWPRREGSGWLWSFLACVMAFTHTSAEASSVNRISSMELPPFSFETPCAHDVLEGSCEASKLVICSKSWCNRQRRWRRAWLAQLLLALHCRCKRLGRRRTDRNLFKNQFFCTYMILRHRHRCRSKDGGEHETRQRSREQRNETGAWDQMQRQLHAPSRETPAVQFLTRGKVLI